MTVDEIRELIQLASETGIAELEVQRGENRVRIRRGGFVQPHEIVMPPAYAATSAPPAPVAPPPAAALPEPGKDKSDKPAADPNLVLVKSPIVGTFYESPSPDAP